jgi:hypothetical protein
MTMISEGGSEPPKKEPYDAEKELQKACAKGIFTESFDYFCYFLIIVGGVVCWVVWKFT